MAAIARQRQEDQLDVPERDLAFINDVRTWVIENRDEARALSNIIKNLARQAALTEKKAA